MLEVKNISKVFAKGTVNEHVAIKNMSLSWMLGYLLQLDAQTVHEKVHFLMQFAAVSLWIQDIYFWIMKKLHIKVSMPGQK